MVPTHNLVSRVSALQGCLTIVRSVFNVYLLGSFVGNAMLVLSTAALRLQKPSSLAPVIKPRIKLCEPRLRCKGRCGSVCDDTPLRSFRGLGTRINFSSSSYQKLKVLHSGSAGSQPLAVTKFYKKYLFLPPISISSHTSTSES